MSYHILFSLFFVTLVKAQLNGEFWWLNGKLNNIKKVKAIPPKIDISDFQAQDEENSRIIFRDDDNYVNKLKPISDRTSKLIPNNNINDKWIVWPEEHIKNHGVDVEAFTTPHEEHMKNHDVDVEVFTTPKVKDKEETTRPIKIQNNFDDVLIFSYPKNEKFVTIEKSKISTESSPISTLNQLELSESSPAKMNAYASKLSTLPTTTKKGESQNICTYTTKKKCHEFNGFVYEYARRIPASPGDQPLICCILPIAPILNKNNISHTIHFPQTSSLKRYKRSNADTNISLKQRNFILKHRFTTQNTKPATTPLTKIVTPAEDDYIDPYWNIKNTKFQTPTKAGNNKYNDYSDDSQEYTDELPKPGLIGLYSDHAQSPSSWPFSKGNKGFGYGDSYNDYEEEYEDENDEEDTFGYSTVDPRKGTNRQRQKLKPQKVTTSDEMAYDAERHTINFQSDPDFNVFQGFKLLNLFRNTSRVHTKTSPKQDTDVLVDEPDNSDENEEVSEEKQIFEGCGKVVKRLNEKDNQIGEAASGSHPWLALVVLAKSRHNLLCYATLVHPRAAITVADCVQGIAPGDIAVIAGLWDLHDKSRSKNRVPTVEIHTRHKPGQVENNLAILHWMMPLKLSANIQPACLGQPQIGDECKLFGWGRLDQGIREARSRWQHATVRACSSRHGVNSRTRLPGDAFCVSTGRGTVTGLGGPLICEVAGHSSIVGAVVSRDNGYVLSPVQDWTIKMRLLSQR